MNFEYIYSVYTEGELEGNIEKSSICIDGKCKKGECFNGEVEEDICIFEKLILASIVNCDGSFVISKFVLGRRWFCEKWMYIMQFIYYWRNAYAFHRNILIDNDQCGKWTAKHKIILKKTYITNDDNHIRKNTFPYPFI